MLHPTVLAPHPRVDRRGVTFQGCLFVAVGLFVAGLAVVVAVGWYANNKITAQTTTPIRLAPVEDAEKVQSGLDGKCQKTTSALTGTQEGSLELSSDELHLLVHQQLPDEIKESVRITLQGDLALVQLPIKGAVAARLIPDTYGTIKGYVAKLPYVNLEAKVQIGLEVGRWTVKVREVTRPVAVSGSQVQGFLDEVLKGNAQAKPRLVLGKDEVTLVGFEIKGSAATARFTR